MFRNGRLSQTHCADNIAANTARRRLQQSQNTKACRMREGFGKFRQMIVSVHEWPHLPFIVDKR